MGRILYIVAKEQPLLRGYLMATVGARSPDRDLVEIKIDERRGERRQQREARDPERRRSDRRRQPNHTSEFRSRGFATVIQSDATPSQTDHPLREPIMTWRPRSTWWHRAARRQRRVQWRRWGLIALLIALVGVSIVAGRSVYRSAHVPRRAVGSITPEPTPETAGARPPGPASQAETISPALSPVPLPSRPPARILSTRASGRVLSVDPSTRTLVLEDMGAGAQMSRLQVELAPDARVALSERDDRAEDLSHPFKETVISLSDVRKGDFAVVEMRGPEGSAVARSIVVTFRAK
jgi:hypothetical protein